MVCESVREIVGRKRTLEILSLLNDGQTRNYSDIEMAIDTSSDIVTRGLDDLVKYRLIEKQKVSRKNVQYSITPRGETFLDQLHDLEDYLGE